MLPHSTRTHPTVDVTHVPVPILVLDERALVVEVNDAWREMTGQSPDAALGRGWITTVHRDDRPRVLAALRAWLAGAERVECEWRLSGGGERTAAMRPAPGPANVLVVALVETTGWRARERELHRLATHDPLTGVWNRAALLDRCAQALERFRRSRRPPGVLFIDLDDFKAINDEHGHQAGDEVLRTVARRIEAAARPCDTFARIGGDELVLLIEDLDDIVDAERIAVRIRVAASEPVAIDGGLLAVEVSVGVAIAEPGDTVTTLLDRADRDLYEHKRLLER